MEINRHKRFIEEEFGLMVKIRYDSNRNIIFETNKKEGYPIL